MTATTFSRLPLLAGSAVAATLGRAGLWTLSRYMRAPLASTGLLALVTLTALAASNALYFQTARHPAPFFSAPVNVSVAQPVVAPVPQPAPAQQTAVLPAISSDTTGGIAPLQQVAPVQAVIPDGPVGNKDAFAVQKKLAELGLFNGTVDGFYGPMTASAIRSFETRNGMTPTGALTPGVIDAILRSDANGRMPVAQQVAPVVQPAPVQQAVVQPQADIVVGRVAELSPIDAAVDTVGTAAASTIDSIVAAVDGGRSTPPQPTANAPVPQRPLLAASAPVQPAPIQVASLEPMAPPRPVTAVQAEPVQQQASFDPVLPANNVQLVSSIQKGLASLGFYHGSIDGHPGDGTAKAIREFENFHSYKVTGQINPDLVGLLRQAGAAI
ncbi:Putative peptidoglycan binding domain-containing protein [Devosia sp. YR412]|uniref:peptidoglycan-binding domain-containing protein n=1 Tax=Devosia sp. YR412 TaxID=1881030 RepID=UPI0008C38E6D|nr:peptidoglycan-binding domain-containing protein [Devosia sp. YR412]SEP77523.1 Putative peptidoglycan binding domain-containing protein [Devosia sp. YR412]